MKIILASNNIGKLGEYKELLKDYKLYLASDFVSDFNPVEDGLSFNENAKIKALALFNQLKDTDDFYVLADDSGLCVEALDDKPGIYSARFGDGFSGNFSSIDERNRAKLRFELARVGVDFSKAKFVCSLCLISKKDEIIVNGECHGSIINKELGKNGFGYDSMFIPDGFDKTFAELSKDEKNKISHRFKALELLKERLNIKRI